MSMLEGAPWLLAHKSMLSVNQPMKISLYGEDYVLWKDENDQIHALSNTCTHMGAALSEGWCTTAQDGSSKVVCPFHALEFDATGCTILPGSHKPTKSLIKPLALIIQNDFIWSYGDHAPKIPIPTIFNEIAADYEFIGMAGDTSVATPLLPMLMNNHDYNHQNGTHRDLFRIEQVQFGEFIDQGHYSEASFKTPTATPTWSEIRRNPVVLAIPKIIDAHLKNYFPSSVIFNSSFSYGTVAQCHFFVPEAIDRTRTYILLFAQLKSPIFRLMRQSLLDVCKTVVDQDTQILQQVDPNQPQQIKLNNEVGMDWVQRNYKSWPSIVTPNLSR
ncbi:Rieske 2Fe-2S domain-containing protein [filamentous cyanobacterium LEGE 11480]|uniref:Rieske 2Fe-2S domain-containing protein n=1 Tax=Romeriopsis navalis LEGE 11480 TaxID=2777977 RepID=A0A928VID5_9CYAN|nr:Rieske 2Fe-2S domain-containing protein [Romeriopsis navalis]MBE9028242.1 Rieske 2Fe-2S domain-containing protein [Romeriopsis navalis LEGE 11480]